MPAPSARHRRHRLAAAVGGAVVLAGAVVTVGPGAALASGGTSAPRAAAAAGVDERMFAVVLGNSGALGESDGHVKTSQKLGNGLDGRLYRVTFDRDIRQCAYFATPTAGFAGDLVNADTGIAIRQNKSFATRQVLDVITKDGGPALIQNDSSFSLLVECRPSGA
jgi:hypothetical protein